MNRSFLRAQRDGGSQVPHGLLIFLFMVEVLGQGIVDVKIVRVEHNRLPQDELFATSTVVFDIEVVRRGSKQVT